MAYPANVPAFFSLPLYPVRHKHLPGYSSACGPPTVWAGVDISCNMNVETRFPLYNAPKTWKPGSHGTMLPLTRTSANAYTCGNRAFVLLSLFHIEGAPARKRFCNGTIPMSAMCEESSPSARTCGSASTWGRPCGSTSASSSPTTRRQYGA